MRILQFGATGQLGRALLDRAAAAGARVQAVSRAEADLEDLAAVSRAVERSDADLVINATAFSLVDKAEAEPAEAMAVNGAAPGTMARACAARGLPFIHVSTDNVFDGGGTRPWREDDAPGPVNAYGRSKLAGELAVREAGGTSLIVRTSWVFSPFGSNFVQIMLGLAGRQQIQVVDDQFACPTPAAALADFLLATGPRLAGPDAARFGGVVHFAGDEAVNRLQFAQAVFAAIGRGPRLEPVPTSAFPTPARRPLNGVLGTDRLRQVYATEPPAWRPALAAMLAGRAASD